MVPTTKQLETLDVLTCSKRHRNSLSLYLMADLYKERLIILTLEKFKNKNLEFDIPWKNLTRFLNFVQKFGKP